MRKVLIVDDETIIRVTLRALIPWEKYGMKVVADCNSGYQALEYLATHSVDLMITDVKMPEISGIELLRRIREDGINIPITVILSGYNEFDLVREAFRLGADDYLLKADMNEENLDRLLLGINKKYWDMAGELDAAEKSELNQVRIHAPECGVYGVILLEVDDFQRQAMRFQTDIKELLERPMWELANQIPKVKRNGTITSIQPGHYVMIYAITQKEIYREEIVAVVRQMQAMWKNYMNLTVSVAICDARIDNELDTAIEYGENLLLLSPLAGKMAMTTEWEKSVLVEELEYSKEKYDKLLSYIYDVNEPGSEKEKLSLFQSLEQLSLSESKKICLSLIPLLALKFREYDGDFFQIFPEDVDYYDKIGRLKTITELERWLNNYFSWVLEYLKQQSKGIQTDIILRAKRFISDNYSNPELTLKTVADYVGLNEKYFTTKFTQKTGNTFRDYVTVLRLEKAKNLLRTTDLKVYEICERIGYNNVEHFNRMFKKSVGVNPSKYRKENN